MIKEKSLFKALLSNFWSHNLGWKNQKFIKSLVNLVITKLHGILKKKYYYYWGEGGGVTFGLILGP